MKIEVYSDLHLEFNKDLKLGIQDDTDVVILAGDIIVGKRTNWIEDLAYNNPDKKIIWVAGNHEYYGEDIREARNHYHAISELTDNLYFLDNSVCTIQDVVFHGTTLWTGFDSKGEAWRNISKLEAERNISDFYRIRLRGSKLSADAMEGLHKEAVWWLRMSLKEHSGKKNVVITHFPPLLECRHPKIEPNILDTYFNNDLGDLDFKDVDTWVYGHNHWSDVFALYGTRFISNQLGYPRETTCYSKGTSFEV